MPHTHQHFENSVLYILCTSVCVFLSIGSLVQPLCPLDLIQAATVFCMSLQVVVSLFLGVVPPDSRLVNNLVVGGALLYACSIVSRVVEVRCW